MTQNIHAITMPRWGMTMTEGRVVQWLASVGDTIVTGQEILEIETEKIANALEATSAGVLRRQVILPQEMATVGMLLGVVADDGVSDAEIQDFVTAFGTRQRASETQDSAAPAARAVEVSDGRINVLSLGEGSSTPAVLIHGFGGDLNSWLLNQPLISADRPVYAIDLPAHGNSSIPAAPISPEAMARTVASALDKLGIGRAHWVGHSLGAAVALLLARDMPARVASLSLISPAGLGAEINTHYIEAFLAAARRPQMKQALSTLFDNPAQMSREMVDDVLRFMRNDGAPAALRALASDAFPGGRQRLVLRDVPASASIPTQIIWGEGDQIIPSSQSLGLPGNVAVHLIANAGHMAHLEQAGRVNSLLKNFMVSSEKQQ